MISILFSGDSVRPHPTPRYGTIPESRRRRSGITRGTRAAPARQSAQKKPESCAVTSSWSTRAGSRRPTWSLAGLPSGLLKMTIVQKPVDLTTAVERAAWGDGADRSTPRGGCLLEKFEHGVYRYRDRHRVKSGMTQWAHVTGLRGDTSLEERVEGITTSRPGRRGST
jgi:hypothetical protein